MDYSWIELFLESSVSDEFERLENNGGGDSKFDLVYESKSNVPLILISRSAEHSDLFV